MDTADRRAEIIGILMFRKHITERELAEEFGVSRRTIMNDISKLSFGFPIYTKQGAGGGVFMMESYKPYNNTLSPAELETLCNLYKKAKGRNKDNIERVLRKYGPARLEL